MSAPDRGYWDQSYPPSVLTPPPPPIPATGATAGIPGTWTPSGCVPPASVAALQAGSVVASPATPWTSGQFVQTSTAGAAGRATWTGTAWVGGAAPLDTAGMTVAEVEAYVTEHPDQLGAALASEEAGKARSTLLAWLAAQSGEPASTE